MPRAVFDEESKTGLGLEIGFRQPITVLAQLLWRSFLHAGDAAFFPTPCYLSMPARRPSGLLTASARFVYSLGNNHRP